MHKFFTTSRFRSLAVLFVALNCLALTAFAQDTGGVKGTVRMPNGEGIAGASVTASQNGTEVANSTSNEKGEFAFDKLKPGIYKLVFEAKGHQSGTFYNVEVKKKKVNNLGDRLMLRVDKGFQVLVQTSVFFKEGTSVTAAKVELFNISSDGTAKRIAIGSTDISGEFTFRRPEGAAKLRVTASLKGVSASKEIEVSEPAIYRTAITLDLSQKDR